MSNPTLPKGNYRVIYTSLRLVVEDADAYLVFQIQGQPRMYFSVPMEGISIPDEKWFKANTYKGSIFHFLNAAYPSFGDLGFGLKWMDEVEGVGGGVTVWLDYSDPVLEDIDREKVRKEYEQWLIDHS